jgi:hypothetical protein
MDQSGERGAGPDGVGTAGRPTEEFAEMAPSRNVPPMPYRDMPEPLSLGKMLGPSVILAGLGVGSGEYILWPFIASNIGLVFMWAAVVGVTLQFFVNMEIERYTLATGETAVVGFARFWKPWGILMCIGAIVPNMFPGWATSGVTIFGYLTGYGEGAVPYITIIALIALGIALTTSPVVYNTMEKAEFFKVGLTFVFLIIAIFSAISAQAVAELFRGFANFGRVPVGASEFVPISVILSGLIFAGAGGANNLVQSNWIRDKGFGMGAYIPRIVSPITGEEVAAPATGSMVRQDETNIRRFWHWWRLANIEQFTTFWFICVFSILTFSLVAYSTVYGEGLAEEADLTFIQAEGQQLANIVGGWFGALFWIFGTLSLILVALGILDYVSRLVADVLKTLYLRENERWSESRMYFICVWALVALGTIILLAGFEAPLILLVTSACISGGVMAVYSVLLLQLNRTALPEEIKLKGWRLIVLAIAALFYIFFVGWFIIAQIQGALGG